MRFEPKVFVSNPVVKAQAIKSLEVSRRPVTTDVVKNFYRSIFPDQQIKYMEHGLVVTTGPKHKCNGEPKETKRVLFPDGKYQGFDVEYYTDSCNKCGYVKKVGVLLDNKTSKAYTHVFANSGSVKEDVRDIFNSKLIP